MTFIDVLRCMFPNAYKVCHCRGATALVQLISKFVLFRYKYGNRIYFRDLKDKSKIEVARALRVLKGPWANNERVG